MKTKRATASDYRRTLKDLEEQQESVEAAIKARAVELCKKYPDVNIAGIAFGRDTLLYLNDTSVTISIDYYLRTIEAIEKHIADNHPHKQTKINF